jgi:hypothetical protein
MAAPLGNKYALGNVGGDGAPPVYNKKTAKQAYRLCLLGHTDKMLADFFEVHLSTIEEWKRVHTEFRDALKAGKELADSHVANALLQSALGYKHKETKFFHNNGVILTENTTVQYPPNPTSAIFWLKNRQRQAWRDTHSMVPEGSPIPSAVPVTIVDAGLPEDEVNNSDGIAE